MSTSTGSVDTYGWCEFAISSFALLRIRNYEVKFGRLDTRSMGETALRENHITAAIKSSVHRSDEVIMIKFGILARGEVLRFAEGLLPLDTLATS